MMPDGTCLRKWEREPEPRDGAAGPDEEALVLAAMRGDTAAFDDLIRRHRQEVIHTARRIVGPELAEDVAQDALLCAFRSLCSLKDKSKFAAWLGAIVRREALRVRRSERIKGSLPLDTGMIEAVQSLTDRATDGKADGPLLAELLIAVETVPRDYAVPLRLHFLQDLPLETIGKSLGLPVSTVKWRIHTGKKVLRERLKILGGPVEGAEQWLHLALRRLPPDCATILFGHAVEGISLSQIAEHLRVPLSRIERQLELARKRLREELIRLGHELGRVSGEPLAWIPCETCRVPTACLSSVCSFSPRNLRKARPTSSERRKAV